eukprot:929168-Lingulodinium_polyedra.AAC.1
MLPACEKTACEQTPVKGAMVPACEIAPGKATMVPASENTPGLEDINEEEGAMDLIEPPKH